ncbi:rRNA pseudouridine synthase [Acinetobacter qingfengensis]|uniref:Pseudouridine synthase n=1 Tax=Acinetobacter qingfengensis TaxID=1262585 RepID=A0A1E7R977_9GAMM|nr:pseudouridine synthase [Acinetobacter qingfengensis]KAA8735479.1 rRNA pseudouridine synthase [Acinetobacter qingfengensis]OEY95876.1 16S rRNA pseudouridine(516) synthase [Acinetobacter qingfengensis]
MQLDKLLQSQGFGSRKHCQQLIRQGQVKINDEIITDSKFKTVTTSLKFTVFQEEYQYREKVYLAIYKPQHYECSHQPQQHHSIFDLLSDQLISRGVQTIGRLDQDTTGLLLLTDDGQFLHQLTHPKKHVNKYYVIETTEDITPEQIEQLQCGVNLHQEKGVFATQDIEVLNHRQCRMAIDQGIYHQVKRMFAAVGNHVVQLHRDQIGSLKLSDLPLQEGEWCYLNEAEIRAASAPHKLQDF